MKGRDWGRIVEKDSRDCATIASIFFLTNFLCAHKKLQVLICHENSPQKNGLTLESDELGFC